MRHLFIAYFIYWLYVLENILICSLEHSSACSLRWPVALFFCLLLSYNLHFFLQLRLLILNLIRYLIVNLFYTIFLFLDFDGRDSQQIQNCSQKKGKTEGKIFEEKTSQERWCLWRGEILCNVYLISCVCLLIGLFILWRLCDAWSFFVLFYYYHFSSTSFLLHLLLLLLSSL